MARFGLALQLGGALYDYQSFRSEHPERSPLLAAGYAALWFLAPGAMMAADLGNLGLTLGPALYYRQQLGAGLNQRFYRPNLSGNFVDIPEASILATQALRSGVSMRQALGPMMGWEARRLYRGWMSGS